MRLLILLLLLTTLIVVPASGENITIEILENFDGDYYIFYNDERIECDADDFCTFNVSNYTANVSVTEVDFSKTDMRKIAQYVFFEIESNGLTSCGVNESFINEGNIVLRNEISDNIGAKIRNTFLPEVGELEACQVNLSLAQNMIASNNAKIESNDATIAGKDAEIKSLERDLEKADFLVIGFGLLLLLSIAMRKHALRDASDFLKNRGK